MMTSSEAYLVGYWLGDGSVTKVGGQVVLCGNLGDWKRVRKALSQSGFAWDRRFNKGQPRVWYVSPGSKKFRGLLEGAGLLLPLDSYTKYFPENDLTERELRSLIAGMFDSDGSVVCITDWRGHTRGFIAYASQSKELVDGLDGALQGLLLKTYREDIPNGNGRSYSVWIERRSYHDFKRLIPLQKCKQEKLERLCSLLLEYQLPKGVRSVGKRFQAYTWRLGRYVHLGTYDTVEEAQKALR